MRRFLVLTGFLTASAALAGCNPPVKQISVPCNCQGTVTPANPTAENQRFATPPTNDQQARYSTDYRNHYSGRQHARGGYEYAEQNEGYGGHEGYRHGDEGSEDSYTRYWSASRVAMNSYDYRSTSRVSYGSGSGYGYSSDTYTSESLAEEPRDEESGWQDGYGRMHSGTHLSRGEFYARMDPWGGYDVDCPKGDHHRYRHRR